MPDEPETRDLVAWCREHEIPVDAETAPALRQAEHDEERLMARLLAELDRRLEAEQDRLARLGEILDGVGALSHKINNPLTSVLGRAQILRLCSDADPRVAKAAREIEESARRVADGIRELALLAQQGKREVETCRSGPDEEGDR